MSDQEVTNGDEGSLTQVLSTAYVGEGKCPFRGYPNRYTMDSRCPATVTCEVTQVKQASGGGGTYLHAHPVPVVFQGSTCQECLDGMVREKEHGMKVHARTPASEDSGGVLKGRREKTPAADAKTRREQRMKVGKRFLEDSQRSE